MAADPLKKQRAIMIGFYSEPDVSSVSGFEGEILEVILILVFTGVFWLSRCNFLVVRIIG
jgi:hypothetical protein